MALLNGRVIGIWSYTLGRGGLSLEVALFDELSKTIQARIKQEAESLGLFLEKASKLTLLS